MRIALLTYRGNMFCGGQGIYAAYLAREFKKAGHDVHVFAGPPLPEVGEDIPLHEIPNDNVFGRDLAESIEPTRPFSILKPMSLWELGVSRFGVFPEMQTFGLRLMRRWETHIVNQQLEHLSRPQQTMVSKACDYCKGKPTKQRNPKATAPQTYNSLF